MRTFMVLLALLLGWGVYALVKNEIAWSKYKVEHHCVEIARHSNPPILMMQSVGQIMIPHWVQQADTVTYKCDGGEVITR